MNRPGQFKAKGVRGCTVFNFFPYIRGFASMSFQSVPCISTGTTLNNRQVYKAFTSFIIPQPNGHLVNVTKFNIPPRPVLVLVVFSLDKEILKWLSICPKYSRKLPKSFFTTEKIENKKIAPKQGKCFPSYSNDSRKTEDESQVEKLQVGQLVSGGKWKSRLV